MISLFALAIAINEAVWIDQINLPISIKGIIQRNLTFTGRANQP